MRILRLVGSALVVLAITSPAAAADQQKVLFSEALAEFEEWMASDAGEQVNWDFAKPLQPSVLVAPAQASEQKKGGPPEGANTGNDPRDFTSKFVLKTGGTA